MWSLINAKVIRGPHWCWGDQDGGSGSVGTIADHNEHEKTVVVIWNNDEDTSQGYQYNIGRDTYYELRLVNLASTAEVHGNVMCDSCGKQSLTGYRWMCEQCHNYDLCTACYMCDKHVLSHTFIRYDYNDDTSKYKGTRLSPRSYSTKRYFKLKSPVWGYESDNEPDIEHYYEEHLPILGVAPLHKNMTQSPFACGDRVTIGVAIDQFKTQQNRHGGWDDDMENICDDIGIVIWEHSNGDCEVLIHSEEEEDMSYQVNSDSLKKIGPFCQGDKVLVTSDVNILEKYQTAHAQWTQEIEQTSGKTGTVLSITDNNNLMIEVEGNEFLFSALVCSIVIPEEETEVEEAVAEQRDIQDTNPNQEQEETQSNDSSPAGATGGSNPPIPTDGCELGLMMTRGSRVKRGKHWKWGNQDMKGPGTVVNPINEEGWISVIWDLNVVDASFRYRMGAENRYDLTMEYDTETATEPESPEVSLSVSGVGDIYELIMRDQQEQVEQYRATLDSDSGEEVSSLSSPSEANSEPSEGQGRDEEAGPDTGEVEESAAVNQHACKNNSTPGIKTYNQINPPDIGKKTNDNSKDMLVTSQSSSSAADGSDRQEASTSGSATNTCAICMDRERDVVFICGHGTCYECATKMKKCHICRKKIKRIIRIY